MGETRVDLQHLLEDIRDAYPGALEETILTEIIANALDSGSSRVAITTDPAAGTCTVVDDGSGMQRRELAHFHDIAASTKTRGQGIGFAGVGIKLGLLVAEEVCTETRRGQTHVASVWHLASRHRAPWRWVPPAGLVTARGTAVRLKLHNPLSPLVDAGFVEGALRRHFQPMIDPSLRSILGTQYPDGVRLLVNGDDLRFETPRADAAALAIRVGRQRKPSAGGYLFRVPEPLPEDQRGLAVSTFGKVIRNGWEWLGITPATPDCIGGVIEVPALAGSLTLNKADFIRTGPRGSVYLAYRKAIQEAVAQQLAVWGDARDPADESRRRLTRPLERDLERVVEALATDFPLLSALVAPRAGAQGRFAIGQRTTVATGREAVAAALLTATAGETAPTPSPTAESSSDPARGDVPVATGVRTRPAGDRGSRAVSAGLTLQFEALAVDAEPARLVESTVWVNTAHPAYQRAVASRSEGYHVALAAALALARVAIEPAEAQTFLHAFLAQWGRALDDHPERRRGR